MNSILASIRKLVCGVESESPFDNDLILHINSCFTILHQLGVGSDEPFMISGEEETWRDFFDEKNVISLVKSWMYLKVRLLFDPPASGVLVDSMNSQLSEFEWRMIRASEGKKEAELWGKWDENLYRKEDPDE